jgi:hypothetical protein
MRPTAKKEGARINSNGFIYPGLTLRSGYRRRARCVPEWFKGEAALLIQTLKT